MTFVCAPKDEVAVPSPASFTLFCLVKHDSYECGHDSGLVSLIMTQAANVHRVSWVTGCLYGQIENTIFKFRWGTTFHDKLKFRNGLPDG